jgi:hypothetical protein
MFLFLQMVDEFIYFSLASERAFSLVFKVPR